MSVILDNLWLARAGGLNIYMNINPKNKEAGKIIKFTFSSTKMFESLGFFVIFFLITFFDKRFD